VILKWLREALIKSDYEPDIPSGSKARVDGATLADMDPDSVRRGIAKKVLEG
jgi:hypothetical protein